MPASALLASLPSDIQERWIRVRHWVEPIPDGEEELLNALARAKGNAHTAWDRSCLSSYEQIYWDLVFVYGEVEKRVRGTE
ncbi:MAG TPA: hypothetical protein VFH52_09910 [Rhodanobacteraceae bacterium]|nr:hypothetical protein [Rhodanobacteraceae bacterium]